MSAVNARLTPEAGSVGVGVGVGVAVGVGVGVGVAVGSTLGTILTCNASTSFSDPTVPAVAPSLTHGCHPTPCEFTRYSTEYSGGGEAGSAMDEPATAPTPNMAAAPNVANVRR